MTRTVLFNCPFKAEIRAVDSQSDFCYSYNYNNNNNNNNNNIIPKEIVISFAKLNL